MHSFTHWVLISCWSIIFFFRKKIEGHWIVLKVEFHLLNYGCSFLSIEAYYPLIWGSYITFCLFMNGSSKLELVSVTWWHGSYLACRDVSGLVLSSQCEPYAEAAGGEWWSCAAFQGFYFFYLNWVLPAPSPQ